MSMELLRRKSRDTQEVKIMSKKVKEEQISDERFKVFMKEV